MEIHEVHEPAVKYQTRMTPEEYLAWERKQETKHEYIGGDIIDMAGASYKHSKLLGNLIGNIYSFLKGKPCSIHPSDLRIYAKTLTYFYPDASIICGEPEFTDDEKDIVKNPSVIFEILSPTTEDYDLGRKFFCYMQIDSLTEYITISSTHINVRVSRRQADGAWHFDELKNSSDTLIISSINYSILLSDIYDGTI